MIGLKRGAVELRAHEKDWESNAALTIKLLWQVFGGTACDIQHVGSTSIVHIKAKPIIDIAVAVSNFDEVLALIPQLEKQGFIHSVWGDETWQLLFVCGDFEKDTRTHHIHVVKSGSMEWINYVNFRDYMNAFPAKARAYESVKLRLSREYMSDREAYTEGKADFIKNALRKALVWSYLGKTVTVKIDRPIGSTHPKHSDMLYPINYGFIPDVIGGDGEELDVYVLEVGEPLEEFTGKVVGIVHRENDVEDKLVAAPDGREYTQSEIAGAVRFQERYYDSHVEVLACAENGGTVWR